LASCFNCEADLAGNRWFESSYPTGPRVKHRVQSRPTARDKTVLAAPNKCLALSNKSCTGGERLILKLGDPDSCCPRHHRDSLCKNAKHNLRPIGVGAVDAGQALDAQPWNLHEWQGPHSLKQ